MSEDEAYGFFVISVAVGGLLLALGVIALVGWLKRLGEND